MSLSITKPTVGGDSGAWGGILNTALDAIVAQINTNITNIAANLPKAGGTMTGTLTTDIVQSDALHNQGTNATIDLDNGDYFYASITSNKSYGFSNYPTSGKLRSWVVEVTNTTGAVSWPINVDWPGGSAPNQTENGTDIYVFWTRDGGTTVFGVKIAEDVS